MHIYLISFHPLRFLLFVLLSPAEIHHFLWQFIKKTRRTIIMRFPSAHTHFRAGQSQMAHRSRNSHITEPSLLLKCIRIVRIYSHITRKQPVLHAGQIHFCKLKSLCTVECHQHHVAAVLIQTVNVSHKRHLRQKSAKRRLLSVLLISSNLTDQFINIFNTHSWFFCILRLQLFDIPGTLYDLLQKLFHRKKTLLCTQCTDKCDKGIDFGHCPACTHNLLCTLQRFIKADPMIQGIILHTCHRRGTNAAFWHIQYTAYCQIILGIVNGL